MRLKLSHLASPAAFFAGYSLPTTATLHALTLQMHAHKTSEAAAEAACSERLAEAHAENRELTRLLELARADVHNMRELPQRLQAELEQAHAKARRCSRLRNTLAVASRGGSSSTLRAASAIVACW